MKSARRTPTAIGLHIENGEIHAYQVTPGGAIGVSVPRHGVGADGSMERVSEAEAARVWSVLRRHGFQGTRLSMLAPASKMCIAPVPGPPLSSGAPVEQLVRSEVARTLRCDASALELGFWELPPPPRAREADAGEYLVAAISHGDAEACIDPFESSGLIVERLVPAVDALPRVLRVDDAVLFDVGGEAGTLLLSRDGAPMYQRRIPECGHGAIVDRVVRLLRVDREAARHLVDAYGVTTSDNDGVSSRAEGARAVREAADGVATQIMDSLRYVAHRFGSVNVGRVLLTGCGAATPGLCEWVEAQTGLDVRVLTWEDLLVEAPRNAAASAARLIGAVAAAASDVKIARAAA